MKEKEEWRVVESLLCNAQVELASAERYLTSRMVGAHASVLGLVLGRLHGEISMHVRFCQEKVQNLDKFASKP